MNTTKPCANYLGIDIYENHGCYTMYIGSFRFAAESLDEAYRIIDRYVEEKDDGE